MLGFKHEEKDTSFKCKLLGETRKKRQGYKSHFVHWKGGDRSPKHIFHQHLYRGAAFVGQMLAQFLAPSFLLLKEELMDSTVKVIVMIT